MTLFDEHDANPESMTNESEEDALSSEGSFNHVLLPLDRMMGVINEHLGICSLCKKNKLTLVKSSSIHLAHQSRIACDSCDC